LIFEDFDTREGATPAVSNESGAERVHGQTACGRHFQTDRIEIMDVPQIEREFRRILKSRKSMPQRDAMAERLFQKISEFHASLADDRARSQFRADYGALAEAKFVMPSSSAADQTPLVDRILDHARNLKEVEATREKLNRELGDF
jgi:hypothetical protein